MPQWYNMSKGPNKTGKIEIFGEISESGWEWSDADVSPLKFAASLAELGDVEMIDVYINSPGGNVYAGIAIGNMLRAHPALVVGHVVGIAASISSVLLQSADERRMWRNTAQFVHAPLCIAMGNAKELRRMADDLDRVQVQIVESYAEKMKIKKPELLDIMDGETLLSAEECIKKGFADAIDEKNEAKPQITDNRQVIINGVTHDFGRFKNFSPGGLEAHKEVVAPPDYSEYEKRLVDCEHLIYGAQISNT